MNLLPNYSLLIVGAGIYGATVARLAHERGERVLVLERRGEVAGNCCDEEREGILVHKYGAHIFHTGDERVWRFVNRFAQFSSYVHRVRARFEGEVYTLPFNLSTIKEVYGLPSVSAAQAQEILAAERSREYYPEPANLEQQAVNLVGRRIYETLVKGYTEKQWGRPATELAPEIIRRLPVRMDSDDRYFSDRYQGLPIGGYTQMVRRMLDGIEVRTDVDFREDIPFWCGKAERIIYTGMIDELLDYELGPLPYRSLRFQTDKINIAQYQTLPVINYTSISVPYTRTIEHKLFGNEKNPLGKTLPYTFLTKEYPDEWNPGREAFYPVISDESNRLYKEYRSLLAARLPKIVPAGRLGLYRYLDMHQAISQAFVTMKPILSEI